MSILKFALFYYGLVALLALAVPAPVGEAQAAAMTGIKPPWPYLWLYGAEHFLGMEGLFYGNVALLVLLLLVPLVDRSHSRAFSQRKTILAAGLVVGLVIVGFSLFAWLAPPEVHQGGAHQHDEGGSPAPAHLDDPAHDAGMPAMPGMTNDGTAGESSPPDQAHGPDAGAPDRHQH